jgi:hypothetical protein
VAQVKTYIVIHHSATQDNRVFRDFDAILREHLARGYRDIGYQWVIELVGGQMVLIPGRNENDVAAGCPGRNVDGIHICCIGNFQEEVPTEELYRFLARLCRDIMTRHPIWEIGGHRDYGATLCPGQYFDMAHLRELVKGDDDLLEDVKVTVKGKEIAGKLIDSKVYVPVRDLVETLNNAVIWDEKDRSVTIK